MARSGSVEEQLAVLAELGRRPLDEAAIVTVRRLLGAKSCNVVARAARLVGERELSGLEEALEQAFNRNMTDPIRRDPGCTAKIAIVEALDCLSSDRVSPFERAIRHRQLEPAWGQPVDTAARLRGVAALGLVRLGHPGLLYELPRLLADAEPETRALAARALGGTGRAAALPVLAFKIHLGDTDPAVLGECFASLLTMDPDPGLELAAEKLTAPDGGIAEAAAMALGESRLDEAFEPLVTALETTLDRERRRVLLLSLALLRRDRAVDHLVDLVADGRAAEAADAMAALRIYRDDTGLRTRLGDIVDRRADRELARAFAEAFGPGDPG